MTHLVGEVEVGGLAHLVRNGVNGFHVPSRDPEALAAAILELLEDRDLRQRLGRQAREIAQQYDWEHIAARIMSVYRELAHPAAVPVAVSA